jgi:CDP-glucose 4,6-dehydratase
LASSDKAYGDQEKLPYTEETALQGVNPYDCSKSCADLIGASYAKAFGLPVVITRCGNFYGGGDLNWNRIVPGTIAKDPSLRGQAFNFSNEIQVTVLQLTEKILAATGKSSLKPVILNEVKHEIKHQYLSAEKARKVLGWKPRFTLDQGLEKTVAWYKEFLGGKS